MRTSLGMKAWSTLIWVVIAFVIVNIVAVIAAVLVNSFGTRWFRGWLPEGFTTGWYGSAWNEFQLSQVTLVTLQIVLAVVVLAAIIGVPAAYALARREFPGKRFVVLGFLLPVLVPRITFGIPLATVLYQLGLGGTFWGVVLANLINTVPFVILIMIPFIEQIDTRIEAAARVFGANTFQLFVHVLLPLMAPGALTALLLSMVRTISEFELTFLTAGPSNQTLVVALYYAVFSPGVRPPQSIDALAVIYMGTAMFWLLIALHFVNPAQIVRGTGRAAK
jgi:putative spermidine/putrescine transport system permease protein